MRLLHPLLLLHLLLLRWIAALETALARAPHSPQRAWEAAMSPPAAPHRPCWHSDRASSSPRRQHYKHHRSSSGQNPHHQRDVDRCSYRTITTLRFLQRQRAARSGVVRAAAMMEGWAPRSLPPRRADKVVVALALAALLRQCSPVRSRWTLTAPSPPPSAPPPTPPPPLPRATTTSTC